MTNLLRKIDRAGRYVEDSTFKTVALVVACLGFFLIALIGVRGEQNRGDVEAANDALGRVERKLDASFLHTREYRKETKTKLDQLSSNISDLQNLLRENGVTPSSGVSGQSQGDSVLPGDSGGGSAAPGSPQDPTTPTPPGGSPIPTPPVEGPPTAPSGLPLPDVTVPGGPTITTPDIPHIGVNVPNNPLCVKTEVLNVC